MMCSAAFCTTQLPLSCARSVTLHGQFVVRASRALRTPQRRRTMMPLSMGLMDAVQRALSGKTADASGKPRLAQDFGPQQVTVNRINDLEDEIEALSDEELQARFQRTKEVARRDVDAALVEVFALVREASFRVLGLRHYDVQLLGGMALHRGCVAEMATGEGKTIVAALPAALNAAAGSPVLVVTVNDYLAKRDAELVGQVHRFLGLSVGLVQAGIDSAARRAAYSCDVTYVTNTELGFDYLRDHLAYTPDDVVITRPFSFCIIDEADSILIDEARTPLIISSKVPAPTQKYATAEQAAQMLQKDVHYSVNEKEQSVLLTERGYSDLETALKVPDLFSPQNPWASFISNALKAKELFKPDVNYIISDSDSAEAKKEIQIVDEFTGRVMKGRRWSEGLHQAIEAKEGITVANEATTAASVSYQAFFKLFDKLAGMTGTAFTEAEELKEIYGLDVVQIPTALPCGRKDYSDVIFKNMNGKLKAVMGEIARTAPTGRPILIGTTSVESSEALSNLLTDVEVPHEVLNAKPESALRESEIVAQAGRKFSITIATNMAGRGTDILLGGNADYFARALSRRELVSRNPALLEKLSNLDAPILIDDDSLPADVSEDAMTALVAAADLVAKSNPSDVIETLARIDEIISIAAEYGPIPETPVGLTELSETIRAIKEELNETVTQEREEVLKLGGLYIIGTDRAESRRVDNQLRGRAGRQGDPGSTRFFLALDDRLFKMFGGDKISGLMETFRVGEDLPLESKMVTNALDSAQENVESYFKDIRQQLFTYDEVLSKQRSVIYAERKRVLMASREEILDRFKKQCHQTAREIVLSYAKRKDGAPDNFEGLEAKLAQFFDGIPNATARELQDATKDRDYLIAHIERCVDQLITERYQSLNTEKDTVFQEATRYIWLTQIDNSWKANMKSMNYLKEFVVLRAYSNDDPLQAYQTEGFEMFEEMLENVRRNTVYSLFQYKASSAATVATG